MKYKITFNSSDQAYKLYFLEDNTSSSFVQEEWVYQKSFLTLEGVELFISMITDPIEKTVAIGEIP